jgi:hypothetical protein
MYINSPTGDPMPTQCPVNLTELSRLLETDDTTYLHEILALYWDMTGETPSELRQHFIARDAKALRHAGRPPLSGPV